MEVPFIGGSYLGRSRNINSQRSINLYPTIDQQQGKNVVSLMGTPGLVEFCNPGLVEEVRGVHVVGSYLYAVIGNTLYKVSAGGAYTAISGSLSKSTDYVYMADNGTELFIVEPGVEGYLYETVAGGSLTAIADADFPNPPESVTFIDGYFVVTETSTGKFYICTLYDGTAWDATDFSTAEQYPDNLQCSIAHRGQLWLIGKESTEVWFNTGAADFPFELIPGSSSLQGTDSGASVATDGTSLYMLDNYKRIVRNDGYNFVPISTPSIDYQISTYSRTNDAQGYTYSQQGHIFYVLNFPSANATWAYDATTGFFHERQSYRLKDADGTTIENYTGRHRSNCYALFGTQHIVGDYETGKLLKYDLDTYTDDTQVVRRSRTAPVLHADRKWLFHHSFEVDFESGVGLATGQGSNPQAMLDWSNDGGHTWGNEHWTSIGAIGKYTARAKWNRLGVSRERVNRVTVSDPVKVVMINAHANLTPGVM